VVVEVDLVSLQQEVVHLQGQEELAVVVMEL
jgi:hypothetical protein